MKIANDDRWLGTSNHFFSTVSSRRGQSQDSAGPGARYKEIVIPETPVGRIVGHAIHRPQGALNGAQARLQFAHEFSIVGFGRHNNRGHQALGKAGRVC